MTLSSLLILLLFTFGATIFYVLLCIEKCTWPIALTDKLTQTVSEEEIRFVHRALKRLIPLLPPSNGVVVAGGGATLFWQAVQRSWDGTAVIIFSFWLAGLLYIIVIGKIAAAVKDVWTTPSDGELSAVKRGVRNLIRQHFNGLLHAIGVILLQLGLVVL